MTYLLLQSFLLLLSAYFAGAMSGCLMKRALMTRSLETAAVSARTSPVTYVEAPAENVPLIKPREIDPVQPRIEVFPRPQRKVLPVSEKIDISRFERALTGPEFNEGMPRKMIVEIRPAILKPVTGPAQPFKKPAPKVEAPKVEQPKVEAPKAQPIKVDPPKAEPVKQDAKPIAAALAASNKVEPVKSEPAKIEPTKTDTAATQAAAIIADQKTAPGPATPWQGAEKTKIEPSNEIAAQPSSGASPMMAGIAGASAAAAAAVAAAKAAAASVVPRAQPAQPSTPTLPSAEPSKPAAEKLATDTPILDRFAPEKPVLARPTTPNVEPAAPQSPASPAPTPAAMPPAPSKPAMPEATAKAQAQPATAQPATPQPVATPPPATGGDDLLRIRAIDQQTLQRLNGIGINSFEQIAHWTPADVNRANQTLGLAGRVDREQWIEQAQILAKGGETYYSRNRGAIMRSAAEPTRPPAAENPATVQPEATAPQKATVPTQPANPAPASPPAQQPAAEKSSVPAQAAAPIQSTPPTPASSAATAQTSLPATSMSAAMQGKSVAEMATAAAAAIAAASASVTRGIRPIEPISPLARANPNLVMPAKLSDALKDNESKAPAQAAASAPQPKPPLSGKSDDLKRIRGIGVLIEKRLNALGITTYAQIANWNSGDIDRISQTLDFKGRIERESWVEHARILSSGGQTEFSRRVDRGDVETSRDDD